MSFINMLKNAAIGSAVGVAAIIALPVFGAVGAISATGMAVGATLGAAAGVRDAIEEDKKKKEK